MNVKIIFAFLTILLLASCKTDNGPEISEVVELEQFSSINMMMAGEVVIKKGATQHVEIKGPEKIVQNIVKNVRSDCWDIRLPNGFNYDYQDLVITITADKMMDIQLSGAGSILSTESQPIQKVVLSGSGKIELNTAADSLSTILSGSGSLVISGKAEEANHIISGSGSLMGYELETEETKVVISGSGSALVNAKSNLNAVIVGSGAIRYIGKPSVTTTVSGSGTVIDSN